MIDALFHAGAWVWEHVLEALWRSDHGGRSLEKEPSTTRPWWPKIWPFVARDDRSHSLPGYDSEVGRNGPVRASGRLGTTGRPYNNGLHQTRRGGAAASRPVVEARLAGEAECSTGTGGR